MASAFSEPFLKRSHESSTKRDLELHDVSTRKDRDSESGSGAASAIFVSQTVYPVTFPSKQWFKLQAMSLSIGNFCLVIAMVYLSVNLANLTNSAHEKISQLQTTIQELTTRTQVAENGTATLQHLIDKSYTTMKEMNASQHNLTQYLDQLENKSVAANTTIHSLDAKIANLSDLLNVTRYDAVSFALNNSGGVLPPTSTEFATRYSGVDHDTLIWVAVSIPISRARPCDGPTDTGDVVGCALVVHGKTADSHYMYLPPTQCPAVTSPGGHVVKPVVTAKLNYAGKVGPTDAMVVECWSFIGDDATFFDADDGGAGIGGAWWTQFYLHSGR